MAVAIRYDWLVVRLVVRFLVDRDSCFNLDIFFKSWFEHILMKKFESKI